jgi:predicted phage replisome organizer
VVDEKYVKLSASFFDDEKVRLIEKLPNGDETLVIWFRILGMASKSNAGGYILIAKEIPFNEEMLSYLFDRPLTKIRYALETLERFGLIEFTDGQACRIVDWEKYLLPPDLAKERSRKSMQQLREKRKLSIGEGETTPKEKRMYEFSDIEMELSKYLFERMRQNNPEAKEPNFQTWSNQIRLMIERDNRKPEQIRNMIDWCQNDSFWKTNILSTKKLRDKYDQLKVRALEDYNRQSGGNQRQRQVQDVFAELEGETVGTQSGSLYLEGN